MAVFMNILKSNSAEKLKEEDTLDLKGLFCFYSHQKYQKINAFLPLFPPETENYFVYNVKSSNIGQYFRTYAPSLVKRNLPRI